MKAVVWWFGTRWMTDLIINIVKEGCTPDDLRKSILLLLFAMIRSVVKSFKVPDVEVAAARMSNESALTRMTDSTPKKPWSDLTLVLDG